MEWKMEWNDKRTQLQFTHVQWNPSIMDTVGDQNFVRYSEVSLTQGLPVYFR